MATEPYGTFFPNNVGSIFSPRAPGQPEVLSKLSNLYQDTSPMLPEETVTPSIMGTVPPRLEQLGPSYIPTGEDEDIFSRYKPETRAQDEYFNLIKNLPVREEPSRGTRILAGLSTLGQGGLKQAENVKYSKYNRQIEDLKLKADMLKELSGAERAGNINERMILNQRATEQRFDRRQTETERKNREQADQANARQRLAKFKADNPDAKFIRMANGNYGVAHPRTGEIIDSGVKYGLSPLEDIMMDRGSTEERLDSQATHAKELEDERQRNRIELAELQNQLREELAKNKELTPEQEKVRQYLIAQQYANTDPDARKFLVMGEPGANTFALKAPKDIPGFWSVFGSDVEGQNRKKAQKYIEIARAIYGPNVTLPKEVLDKAKGPAGADTPAIDPNYKKQVNPATGAMRESHDGGKTWTAVKPGAAK